MLIGMMSSPPTLPPVRNEIKASAPNILVGKSGVEQKYERYRKQSPYTRAAPVIAPVPLYLHANHARVLPPDENGVGWRSTIRWSIKSRPAYPARPPVCL